MNKIKELLIDWENLEFDDLGVSIMSLVDKPAIQTNWLAFSEEDEDEDEFEFASITDYPQYIKDAAERGIRLNEEVGNECATQVGKVRAQQLAQGKPISLETVKRMYSYLSRAMTYYNEDDTTACGTISVLLWGGPDALKWANNKIQQVEEEMILEVAQEYGEEVDYREVTFVDLSQNEFSTIGDYLKGVTALDILGKRDLKKDEEGVTKYRYAGRPAERNYCKAMLRMQKLYTRQEIEEMSRRVDTGFRHNNSSYSIFDFKGGVNCKHYWEEVVIFKGNDNRTIMISKGPASGRAGEIASASNNYWKFASEEEQIVVGPAMVPNRLILRKDELGNPYHVYFSTDTIKKISKKFLETSNHNNTDINHSDIITTQNTLLESWIIEDPKKDKSALYGFDLPKNTWMVSYKINDTETWNKIKAGELNGFSVTGTFIEKLQ